MTKEDTIEGIVTGFMGYCSVRYSMDNELAMSDEDIKQMKDTAKAIKQHYLGKLPKEEELPSKDCYCNGEISFCSYCSRIIERNKALADVRKVIGGEDQTNQRWFHL